MAGNLVYFELPAADAAQAKEFYGSLLGWKFNTVEGEMEYYIIDAGEQPGGGLYPAQAPDDRSAQIYFATEDIDASIAKVRELGGNAEDKSPVPGMGWFARCKDPGGTTFSLWQGDEGASA